MEAVSTTKRIHQLWPTIAAGLALVLVFIGERVLAGSDSGRITMAVGGGGALLVAAAMRFRELATAPEPNKPVARILLGCTVGLIAGLALYALIALVFTADDAKNTRAILWAPSLTVLICSAVPLLLVEIATSAAAFIDRYEHGRVRQAFQRGLALALLLCSLVLINFLANRHEVKWDLSYGQRSIASEQTRKAVRDLSEPVKVRLFFPRGNEVAEFLTPYFESLSSLNPNLAVERVDHALAGQAAKDAGVTENGYIAISREKNHDKIRIGEKMTSARSALRKLDQNFIASLIKVTREKKTAYFTVGHGERSYQADAKETRSGLKILKELLDRNQFTTKNLGIAEGLSDKLPEDAAVVFMLGAEKEVSPAEIEAINRSIEKGGARMLIALEAEREGQTLDALLAPLGLKFDRTILANERSNVPLTRTEADRTLIWSNRYSSHESVTTMTRNAKLATVFSKTGSLSKLSDKAPERTKVEMVLTAIDDTFADADNDLTFDRDGEKKSPFGLAAAITRTSTSGKKADETRLFIIADADVFTDDLIRFEGNLNLLADVIYWLRAVEDPVVPTISAEDVQIVHKKEEDAFWFYSTTLGVPALVLSLGLVVTRRRRRT
jgi:hypothetical protein